MYVKSTFQTPPNSKYALKLPLYASYLLLACFVIFSWQTQLNCLSSINLFKENLHAFHSTLFAIFNQITVHDGLFSK